MQKRKCMGKPAVLHHRYGMMLAGLAFLIFIAGVSVAADRTFTATNDDPPTAASAKEQTAKPAEPQETPTAEPTQEETKPGTGLGNDPKGFVVKKSQVKSKNQDQANKPGINLKSSNPQAADKAKAGGKGCGSTPGKTAGPTPNPDGPQPKYVCKEPKNSIGEIWRGTNAEFVFTIGNEGEGDLQIRLKGG